MAKKPRGFIKYRTYVFTDKDPIIDYTRTAVEDSHNSYGKISELSGVSTTTLYNWYHGKTRRPQFATAAAVLMSCGINVIDLKQILRRK